MVPAMTERRSSLGRAFAVFAVGVVLFVAAAAASRAALPGAASPVGAMPPP